MTKRKAIPKPGQKTATPPARATQGYQDQPENHWWQRLSPFDWRLSLALFGVLEVLLVLSFIQREMVAHHSQAALKAFLKGDYGRACEHYDWLAERSPENVSYLLLESETLLEMNRPTEAVRVYEMAARTGYDSPVLKILAARIYFSLGTVERNAEQRKKYMEGFWNALDAARAEAPGEINVNYWWGYFSERMGNLIDAARYYSRVRADMLPPYRNLSEIEKALIKKAGARLEEIQKIVLGSKDYYLDVAGLEVPNLPPPTPLDRPSSPSAAPPVTPFGPEVPALGPTVAPPSAASTASEGAAVTPQLAVVTPESAPAAAPGAPTTSPVGAPVEAAPPAPAPPRAAPTSGPQ